VALIDAFVQPCRGFAALNGQYVGYRPRTVIRR